MRVRPMAMTMRRWLALALAWFAVRRVIVALLMSMIMAVAVIVSVVLGRVL